MKSIIPALVSCLFVSVILLVAPSNAVFSQVPEIENAIPSSVPIKVEIIAPKNADDYPEQIAIKVTNTGSEPIVSLRLYLEEITDEVVIAPDGKRTRRGMPLIFGRRELNSGNLQSVMASDPSIDPNKEYILRISKYYKKIKDQKIENGTYQSVSQYRLRFIDLTYPSSSGYTSNGKPFSKKN